MDLVTLTRGRLIRLGQKADAKERAIEILLDFLIGEHEIPENARHEVLEAILNRERRLSTGLEHGVAIPHGITTAIDEEVAAIGVFPDGVPFDACDGLPARIVILLITPDQKRYRHVTNLAEIARQMRRRGLREVLCRATDLREAVDALRAPTPPDGD
jgi:PTS system nitrogen regulatory IIA component